MPTFPPAHELECSVRTAAFQAGPVIGSGVADRWDSGGLHAYRDDDLAHHRTVARSPILEVLPSIEQSQIVQPGRTESIQSFAVPAAMGDLPDHHPLRRKWRNRPKAGIRASGKRTLNVKLMGALPISEASLRMQG